MPSSVTAGTVEEQLLARHDRQVRELARVAPDEHEHRAEPGRLRLHDELQATLGVVDEHRRRAMAERRGDRPLGACGYLEQLQRELLALLGERAGGRRQTFTFGKRLLERGEPFACELHACVEILALAHRGACCGVGLVGDAAELSRRRTAWRAPCFPELGAQLCEQPLRRLVSHAEPLGRPAQRKQRVAAPTGEQRLCLRAAVQYLVELGGGGGLRLALDRCNACPPLLRLDLQPATLAGRGLRGGGGDPRRVFELGGRARVVCAGRREVGPQQGRKRSGRLAPKLDALAPAPQPVQRGSRLLARARRVGELLLGVLALGDERGDLLVERAPFRGGCGAAALGLRATLGELREVERRDCRLQPRDLDAELLGALRGRRLQRKGP